VVTYFARTLKDPESARYTFLPLVNGVSVMGSPISSKPRLVGWFVCGTVNSKNSCGGYVGAKSFLAYFDPRNGNRVEDGSIEGDYDIVGQWCHELYTSGAPLPSAAATSIPRPPTTAKASTDRETAITMAKNAGLVAGSASACGIRDVDVQNFARAVAREIKTVGIGLQQADLEAVNRTYEEIAVLAKMRQMRDSPVPCATVKAVFSETSIKMKSWRSYVAD
jgi:hypothetical protein